jgi:hypothetical protein
VLVNDVYAEPRRKRIWSPEHHAAVEQYNEALSFQMQDASEDELSRLIVEVEKRTGLSVSAMEADII